MRLNNPSRMRKDYKQVKNEQNCRVSSTEVIGPEEMPILLWGRRKHPPTKMGLA